jgi:hypothetical protein
MPARLLALIDRLRPLEPVLMMALSLCSLALAATIWLAVDTIRGLFWIMSLVFRSLR